jgi:plasmid stabilization system protein ParE
VKAFRVFVTPEAELGIVSAFRYIEEHSPLNAEKWLRGLYARIDTLEQMPERCALAREAQFFGEDLRQLIFKSHRIVFRIEEEARIVRVLYILHGKQLGHW